MKWKVDKNNIAAGTQKELVVALLIWAFVNPYMAGIKRIGFLKV